MDNGGKSHPTRTSGQPQLLQSPTSGETPDGLAASKPECQCAVPNAWITSAFNFRRAKGAREQYHSRKSYRSFSPIVLKFQITRHRPLLLRVYRELESMAGRSGAVIVAVLVIIGVGGIGFAAFTASVYIDAQASAGTIGPLSFSSASTSVKSGGPPGSSCSVSIGSTINSDDTLQLDGSNLAIGYPCEVAATLNNAGTFAGALTTSIVICEVNTVGTTPTNPSPGTWNCGDFGYSQSPPSLPTIPAGGSIGYAADYGLLLSATGSAAGESVIMDFTITGTPT